MNTCPNCGKVAGLHSSILQGCMCQYSMQEPPQRTWVGLTDEDCDEFERWVEFKEEGSGRIPMGKLARYIEAKLKEKNGA